MNRPLCNAITLPNGSVQVQKEGRRFGLSIDNGGYELMQAF